jgi:signal peptidase II
MTINKQHLLPFALSGFLILADQGVKSFIAHNWPRSPVFIKDVFNNDLVWIIHVRNKAIAFSLGESLPDFLRFPLFIAAPIIVVIFLIVYYLKSTDLTNLPRWAIAGIIGGGAGNMIDRVFRPEGVVDFLSVKFFGLLGFDRWPTFNIADASVVVSVFIFMATLFIPLKKTPSKEGDS